MKSELKKITGFLAASALCGSMLLSGSNDTFDLSRDLSASAAEEGIEINAASFPDENFRAYVDEKFDEVNDDILTAEECADVTRINVAGMGITDLTGIEHFPYLETLYCYENSLTELDVSENYYLDALWCGNNALTELNVSSNANLTSLQCYGNLLTAIDVSNNLQLTDLDCHENQLTELDLSKNTLLEALYCGSNQLHDLDLSHNKALRVVKCSYNQLYSLDLSNCAELRRIDCESNQLNKLNVRDNPNLEYLNCSFNQLTSLDISDCPLLAESLLNFSCISNEYTISLTDGTFDLSSLPEFFDAAKVSAWENAKAEDTVLTIINPAKEITYQYNIGFDELVTFTLVPASCSLAEAAVSEIGDMEYTGSAITPVVTVEFDDVRLTEGEDYLVSYENNVNPGTATITITAIGDFYTGTVTANFTITAPPVTTTEAEATTTSDSASSNTTTADSDVSDTTTSAVTTTTSVPGSDTTTSTVAATTNVDGSETTTSVATSTATIPTTTSTTVTQPSETTATTTTTLPQTGYSEYYTMVISAAMAMTFFGAAAIAFATGSKEKDTE